jgi:DNA-binding MarR family transcriptional regulator
VPAPDRIDELVAQWSRQRPDLDTAVMAEVGRLLVLARLIERRLDATAAEFGVHRSEGDVLFTLRRAGPPHRLSPTALSASLLVSTGTMTNRLDRLEARGLVRRRPNPDDRRGLAIELTEAGIALADRAVEVHVAREEELLAGLDARERAQLTRLTRKLLAHLGPPAPAA